MISRGISHSRSAKPTATPVQQLQEHGKEEDAGGIKAWLRRQHAETIRERKRAAAPLDSIYSAQNFIAGCAPARNASG
jgi:hypothetical protein